MELPGLPPPYFHKMCGQGLPISIYRRNILWYTHYILLAKLTDTIKTSITFLEEIEGPILCFPLYEEKICISSGGYRANQINVYHVMCTIQDVEGSNGRHVGSPGIMGLPESLKQDAQSTDFVNPKTLTNSRISLDELKKDLCSNKIQ